MRRLWCSFLAAPMFPMARVKDDIMTRTPRMGMDQRSWRKRRKETLERKILM